MGLDLDPGPHQAHEEAQRRQREAMRGRRKLGSARDASSSCRLSPTDETPRPHSVAAVASAISEAADAVAMILSVDAIGMSVPGGAAQCSPGPRLSVTAWVAPEAEPVRSPMRLYDEVEYF